MKPATLLLFALAGCSTSPASPVYDNSNPPPLTVSFASDPAPFPDGVPVDATIVASFDDFPDPDTVAFGPVLLRSGKGDFDADVRVDLLGQSIRVRGRSPLVPGTQYSVTITTDVRSLGGRTLPGAVTWTFTAGAETSPARPTLSQMRCGHDPCTWPDVQAVLANAPGRGCGSQACHSPTDLAGQPTVPARLLDLTGDPRDPRYGLIDVPSVGLSGTFSQLVRVLPGDSSRSVLLRKLLGGGAPAAAPETGEVPYPNTRVDGKRMPIDLDGLASAPLDPASIAIVQQWIDDGARMN
jgi:hypothetical protein